MSHEQSGLARFTFLRLLVLLMPVQAICWGGVCLSGLAEGAERELVEESLSQQAFSSLRTALGLYDEVREELVADRLEGVQSSASQLTDSLGEVPVEGPELAGEIRDLINEAVVAGENIAGTETLSSARIEFAEMSRLILLLAKQHPELVEGWHVFACPMVKTFPKWIQPTDVLQNPYMGQAMPACGFASDWSVPDDREPVEKESSSGGDTDSPEPDRNSGAEPVFKPGIPGVKMQDVRDHKFLWREIEELQKWERLGRISVAEFRSKVIEKTAHFLELSRAAAEEFTAVASKSVENLRESYLQARQAGGNTVGLEKFSGDLGSEVSRVTSVLQDNPRHQLFAPDCKKWLLKLAFGPAESKESE